MKITYKNIKTKDIFAGFSNDGENGVFAYGGKLTIRPAYQRKFYLRFKTKGKSHTYNPKTIPIKHNVFSTNRSSYFCDPPDGFLYLHKYIH